MIVLLDMQKWLQAIKKFMILSLCTKKKVNTRDML